MENKVKNKKLLKVIGVILAVFIILSGVCFVYVSDYYHADETAMECLHSKTQEVEILHISQGYFFDGSGQDKAMIFYPGAKVEYTSYAPLLYAISAQGIDCFLVEMPLNLAFLGINKAEEIIEKYNYQTWYMSGHSLGGAFAALYAADNEDKISGVVLLAAYSTSQFSNNMEVLSIYGSNDQVLNYEKFENNRVNLPVNAVEICIEGGNHAQFGNYGKQSGDKEAQISTNEQQAQTVSEIIKWSMGGIY